MYIIYIHTRIHKHIHIYIYIYNIRSYLAQGVPSSARPCLTADGARVAHPLGDGRRDPGARRLAAIGGGARGNQIAASVNGGSVPHLLGDGRLIPGARQQAEVGVRRKVGANPARI